MPQYTNLNITLEDKLVKKLDVFCKMVSRDNQKQDAWFIIHGYTGSGKTNTSLVTAYYCKDKLKRDIHLFFRLEGLIKFAQSTENKIIIWDEPALDSMSTDQMTTMNKNLKRLMNIVRKKRHIVITNLTKFWRFSEELVVDRSLAMIHMDDKRGKTPGRFLYIRQKYLEGLWNYYQKTGKRAYGKFKSFGGWIPEMMERKFDENRTYFDMMDIFVEGKPHATLKDYEKEKDKSIETIGEAKISKRDMATIRTIKELRYKVAQLPLKLSIPQETFAGMLGISSNRLREWRNIDLNAPISLEKDDFEGSPPPSIINTMG